MYGRQRVAGVFAWVSIRGMAVSEAQQQHLLGGGGERPEEPSWFQSLV